MDNLIIDVEKRPYGKSVLKKLKHEGMIPGVVYDNGGSIPIALKEEDVTGILKRFGEDAKVEMNLDGQHLTVKIHQIQRDPMYHTLQHLDLMPIDKALNTTYLH